MRIAVFGATGTLGSRVTHEALERGHTVVAVLRDPARLAIEHRGLEAIQGDVRDANGVARALRGVDAVISAVGPRHGSVAEPPTVFVEAARALIAGARAAGVKRIVVVGGAGSLETAPGVRVLDAPGFPSAWKANALGQAEALAVYRSEAADLDWTYVSPAAVVAPGERTGRYRTGGDTLLQDERGDSRISAADYAVALIDEVEAGRHRGRRITVAY